MSKKGKKVGILTAGGLADRIKYDERYDGYEDEKKYGKIK